mgnify:FL=1
MEKLTINLPDGRAVAGLLLERRVSAEERKLRKYRYQIRHSDDDWDEPATLEKGVVVNFFGNVLTDEPVRELESGEEGYLEIEDFCTQPMRINQGAFITLRRPRNV